MAVKVTPRSMTACARAFPQPRRGQPVRPRQPAWQYTTQDLLDAEARLLDAGRDTTGPTGRLRDRRRGVRGAAAGPNHGLGADQAVAVEQIATSGRVADLLVGPAGTGKTTTLAGLRAAWEAEHGAGTVKGLGPLGGGGRQPGRGARDRL